MLSNGTNSHWDRFDIRSLAPQTPGYVSTEDEAGMLISSRRISQYISDEVDAGIPSDRIVVGGFSQGELMEKISLLLV